MIAVMATAQIVEGPLIAVMATTQKVEGPRLDKRDGHRSMMLFLFMAGGFGPAGLFLCLTFWLKSLKKNREILHTDLKWMRGFLDVM